LARILPVVYADDVDEYVRFLVAAFGLEMNEEWTDPADANHVNVELRFGESVISICRANPEAGTGSAQTLDAEHFGFYVEVDDVDAHFERAVAAGASITSPIETQPWGARMYAARDPEGYGWSFASL
jgi:PhnB protein